MAIIPEGQKILTSAPEVNTTYGGPDSLKALNTWYTMQDIANTVQPYKVFTALLTQTGDNGESLSSFGDSLLIGRTYKIEGNDGNTADFTNVGAPNNLENTYFIATGTTPNSWGANNGAELVYNTGAPVATVLENTIGNIWFTYEGIGYYYINSSGLFTNIKTINTIDQTVNISRTNDQLYYVYCYEDDTNYLALSVLEAGLNGINSLLYNKLIEIRVYN